MQIHKSPPPPVFYHLIKFLLIYKYTSLSCYMLVYLLIKLSNFTPLMLHQFFQVVLKMVSYIYFFLNIVLKIETLVLW